MTEVNASIPLAAGNIQGSDPNQLMSMLQFATQVKQQQVATARQNALLQTFADPNSVDPATGTPTPQTVRKVMSLDPALGMKMQGDVLDTQVKRAQAEHYKTEAGKNNFDFMSTVAGVGYDAYEEAKKAGKPEEEAISAGQAARNDAVANNGGVIGNDVADGITSKPFIPAGAKALASTNKDWDNLRHQKVAEEATAKAAQFNLDKEAAREKETNRRLDEQARRDNAVISASANKGWSEPYTTKDGKTISINKNTGETREIKVDGLHKVGTGSDGGEFTPEMGALMGALAEKGVSLPAGMRSKSQQVQLYKGILDRNPGKTPDEVANLVKTGQIEFGAQKKETQTAAGVAGKVEVAQNEIEEFLPLVREASAKVQRGKFVPLTKLLQTADSSLSDPNLKVLKGRINALLNAYDMLASRGGTDVDKRAEVRNLLTSADSPEAFEAQLGSFEQEAAAAHRAAVKATRVPELNEPAKGSAGGKTAPKVLRYDAKGNLVP